MMERRREITIMPRYVLLIVSIGMFCFTAWLAYMVTSHLKLDLPTATLIAFCASGSLMTGSITVSRFATGPRVAAASLWIAAIFGVLTAILALCLLLTRLAVNR